MSENNTYTAKIYKNNGLSVDAFTQNRTTPTPGNVGICLSGGGSRALSSAMGQLRALNYLKTKNGVSLLSQTKALSTVSGGSWFGITFSYQSTVPDENYLNHYESDPGNISASALKKLPEGNQGKNIGSDFSVLDIALQAVLYHIFHDTPANMLWQTVIGKTILEPYGLYTKGAKAAPTHAFSYDTQSVDDIINLTDQNPALTSDLFHTLSSNAPRPFPICNTSMFVTGALPDVGGNYQYLAPVQCTPFFTGIVGTPGGTDANGVSPGGGGVSSFAFNSALIANKADMVSITEQRPWSLMDIVGASSAAFAELVQNKLNEWAGDHDKFLSDMNDGGSACLKKLKNELSKDSLDKANTFISSIKSAFEKEGLELANKSLYDLGLGKQVLQSRLKAAAIVPQYDYWPVLDIKANPNIKPTAFADGGNLENTGIAAMLCYTDIDSIVACVNSPTLLTPGPTENGISPAVVTDETTKTITTEIGIDSQISGLFGYEPFAKGQYKLYKKDQNLNKKIAASVHNQIFPSADFSEFLGGIWTAAQGSKAPAILKQTLSVVENTWFGVPARKSIKIVWVYTSTVSDWTDLLQADVQEKVKELKAFPNYATLDTQLTATQVNLLSSLTAWSIANDNNKNTFIDLFE